MKTLEMVLERLEHTALINSNECLLKTELKRSNSVPIIHEINTSTDNKDVLSTKCQSSTISISKARSFSESNSPVSLSVTSNRINQLKRESSQKREIESEFELHSVLKMSQSYEDSVNLIDNGESKKTLKMLLFPQEFESLTLNVSSSFQCSPCSSSSSSPSKIIPSPSPTNIRQSFLTSRSLSPIRIRPSVLNGTKRKIDDDNEYGKTYKRFHNGTKSPRRYISSPLTIDPVLATNNNEA